MGIRRYEDLVTWQLARELERRVVEFTATGAVANDFDYCRQIRGSSSSAARNLAEGFGRYLPGDFARFARIALGSLNETRDHLASGREKGYLSDQLQVELVTLTNRAIGASVNLVNYLDGCAQPPRRRRPFSPFR